MAKPDAKKMAGEFPTDWAVYADFEDGSIFSETVYLLIAKAKMLNKRYKGKQFKEYNIVVEDVRVDDLGVYCLFIVGNINLVTSNQCKEFEKKIKREAKTYFNLTPSFEYQFALWK